jgi:hypothetical protein
VLVEKGEIDRRSLSRQGDPGGNEAAVTRRIFLAVGFFQDCFGMMLFLMSAFLRH